MLNLLEVNTPANTITINGFNNSIGWNRGKNIKSNHLLEPFTWTPMKGTRTKKIKQIINRINEILSKFSFSIDEKKKINKKPNKIYMVCFKKK